MGCQGCPASEQTRGTPGGLGQRGRGLAGSCDSSGGSKKEFKAPQGQKLRGIILKDRSPKNFSTAPGITMGWWQCGWSRQSQGGVPGCWRNSCPGLLGQTLPWLPVLAGAGAGQRDRPRDQPGLVGREQRLPESRSSPARAGPGGAQGAAGELQPTQLAKPSGSNLRGGSRS